MFSLEIPAISDLSTSRQLVRSTLVPAAAPAAILVAIVLPWEYAVGPSGIGRVLALSEMGEIKIQLAQEAAAETAKAPAALTAAKPAAVTSSAPGSGSNWRRRISDGGAAEPDKRRIRSALDLSQRSMPI